MIYTIYEVDKYDVSVPVAEFMELRRAQEFLIKELVGTENEYMGTYFLIKDSEGNKH